MDEDILAELERQLTNVNLDKYWVRKVGDFELWLAAIDYTQSNKVKKVIEGEFGYDEAKRVTVSAAIVGINGVDLRHLRSSGKTIKVAGKDGRSELVDLPEFIYRKIANWDVEFVEAVFDVYADLIETHKRDLTKEIVFENAKSAEQELDDLEQKAAALRERLGKPPLVEAQRLSEEGADEAPVPAPEAEQPPPARESSSFQGEEDDFDPFEHVKAMRATQPQPQPAVEFAPPPAPPSVPVPVPPVSSPSAIEEAMAQRRANPPIQSAPSIVRPAVRGHVAQPSVPSEVLEKGAPRVVVDPPKVNPNPGGQSKNPRFRNAGIPR